MIKMVEIQDKNSETKVNHKLIRGGAYFLLNICTYKSAVKLLKNKINYERTNRNISIFS